MSTPKLISGRDNKEFKRFLAARARRERDLILVEGPKLVDEALRSHLPLEAVAFSGALEPREAWGRAPVFRFADPLMKSLSDVETHQGVLALFGRPKRQTEWLLGARTFVLILDGVQDPGNVGTLFRTAEAAGVSGILLTRGCADPLSPKALRASAGSAFRLPHIEGLDASEVRSMWPGPRGIAAAVAGPGARSVFEAPLELPLALALGSEGSGLSPELAASVSQRITIPHATSVESLNVAVAGGIVMFEIARRAGLLS